MKKYRVIWRELHSQEVWAKDEDEAFDLIDGGEERPTYKSMTSEPLQLLEEEDGPDPMDVAHAKSEDS